MTNEQAIPDDQPAGSDRAILANLLFWIAVGALVLGIIVAGNVVAGVVFGWGSFDLTTDTAFTLSPVTEETLQAITAAGEPCELEIYVAPDQTLRLYQPALHTRVARMLRLYAQRSPHISASFFTQQDHEGEFVRAGREVPGFMPNCVVVRYGGRSDVLSLRAMTAGEKSERFTDARGFSRVKRIRYEFRGEAALTSALQRAHSGVRRKIYATVGHSEARWEDSQDPDGLGHWKARLEGMWMDVRPISLAQSAVPPDCDILVIAGPRAGASSTGAFSDGEVDAVENYLSSGGGVLLMLDSGTDPKLSRVLQSFGVVAHPSTLAVDPGSVMAMSGKDDAFFASRYAGSHPITAGFGGNAADDEQVGGGWTTTIPTAWSQCAVVLPARSARAGVRVTGLVATSPDGWGETEPLTSSPHRRDRDRDVVGGMKGGGVTVAVAAEATASGGRLVVLGTRRLVSNEPVRGLIAAADDHPRWQSNLALMRNTLSWLAGEDQLVSGVAGRGARTRLELDRRAINHLFSIAFLYVPLTILLAGLTAWAHRRRGKRILMAVGVVDLVYALYLCMRVLAPLESF